MDFNKIAKDMLDLQTKLEVYEARNNQVKELLTILLKENLKLEKKLEKEESEIDKITMQLKIAYNKKMIKYVEGIYIEAGKSLSKKEGAK